MEIDNILEVASTINHDRTVYSVLSKVIEEVGEVATEINKGTPREAQREIADAIIALVDLHYQLSKVQEGGSLLSSVNLGLDIETKTDKWMFVYGNNTQNVVGE